jgi:hypothetical protein
MSWMVSNIHRSQSMCFKKVSHGAQVLGTNKTDETFWLSRCFNNLEIIGKGGKQNISLKNPNCWWKTSTPCDFSSQYLEKKFKGLPFKFLFTFELEAIKSQEKGPKLSQNFMKYSVVKLVSNPGECLVNLSATLFFDSTHIYIPSPNGIVQVVQAKNLFQYFIQG